MGIDCKTTGMPVDFSSLCLHSLPLFLTTPASGQTMSFLCVCIPGLYALTNKVMPLWPDDGRLNNLPDTPFL